LKEVEPSATREFFIEKSSTTFANLGGLSEVKRLLDAVFEHSPHARRDYEQVGLAPREQSCWSEPSAREKRRWRARFPAKSRFPLIAIVAPQLYSKWLGESSKTASSNRFTSLKPPRFAKVVELFSMKIRASRWAQLPSNPATNRRAYLAVLRVRGYGAVSFEWNRSKETAQTRSCQLPDTTLRDQAPTKPWECSAIS